MLLAREPEARIDLVTRRAYLYDHSRIRLHDIDDAAAIETLLEESFDGLVWLDEIHAPEMRRHAWVPGALAAKAASSMTLVLEAATHRGHLDFRRLVVDGTDLGPALGAARSTPHILEQLELLALALGLPWLREGCGTSAAPFVGIPSKAARSWLRRQRRHLRQRQQVQGDAGQRPLAVVQPFGGAAEIKGYGREHLAELATALDDLVEEGLEVILLPTAAPWGAPTRIARLLETIQPQTRLSIIVAPNTAGGLGDVEERSELDLPDRTIRLFKYLIAAADLVVAVEGWAAHLAALLDTPVRLVLWAGSYGPDWYPRGCEWADSLSPSRLARSDSNPPLTALHRAPLSRARRQLLAGAMNGLGQPSERAASLLRAALRNPDPALRTHAANAAWTQLDDPPLGDAIRAALEDPSAPVRAAAAHTLLRRPDLHRPTDPRRATLEAHRAIDDLRWSAVVTLGD
ncbi:MAG: hypothetical protein MI919_15735, partial [Holophagales bacterium]|nr:hypothetical protein [Holophagales bacterium]